MRNVVQKIKSLFKKVEEQLLPRNSTSYRAPAPSQAADKSDQFKQTATTFVEQDNNYMDRHIYWRMDPLDKKKPKFEPLRSFPQKEVYQCFGWQLHPYDIQKLSEYIDTNPRLSRIENRSLIAGASEADILILTSGSGKYHIDSFLCDLDTSEKIIIIASVRNLESIKEDITHRIDAHFNKLQRFSQSDFNNLIDKVIKDALTTPRTDVTKIKKLKRAGNKNVNR